ncbi:hypothetical protein [Paenibacillus sp. GXUN7292]|uniref:hypothetical protein n=1 Tax=Paenibacillus sp. GXUN7292 TaxID=3422499 RepID=UPI003D7EA9AE
MKNLLLDIIKLLVGGGISVITTYVVLLAENKKNIQTRKHELALKELGEKLFAPLLLELTTYESKNNLQLKHTFNLQAILEPISKYQFEILLLSEETYIQIQKIYDFAVSTSNTGGDNVKTQDTILFEHLNELRNKLRHEYFKYRM